MKDLKITSGHAFVRERSTKNNQYIEAVLQPYPERPDFLLTIYSYQLSSDECLSPACSCVAQYRTNATLYADAHNTYQSTGTTASELAAERDTWKRMFDESTAMDIENYPKMVALKSERAELEKQRDELLEALKHFTDKVESGRAKSKETYSYYKGILERFAAIQSVEQKQS